jgi:SsrA-binding protein
MGGGFIQLSGEDATALGFMAHGGHGCISVTSNVAPRLCADFQNACLNGDFKTALALQDRLMPLHDALFCESNPGPVKYAASRLGLCEPDTRLPLAPIADASKRIVDAALARVGLIQAKAAEEGIARALQGGLSAMAAKTDDGRRIVAENRQARHEYFITDTLEAGLQLTGTEVKSLRKGQANIAESYASAEEGGLWLINAYIPEYQGAGRFFQHEPRRKRRLLLHKKEIHKLAIAAERQGMTLVPLELYFNQRGIAKLKLALAQGKKLHDKREAAKKRDWNREKARLMREKG